MSVGTRFFVKWFPTILFHTFEKIQNKSCARESRMIFVGKYTALETNE
jgi:hypothetical protein